MVDGPAIISDMAYPVRDPSFLKWSHGALPMVKASMLGID
jgi:hypothetical protein